MRGDTIMQGSQDIAVHVAASLNSKAKAVIGGLRATSIDPGDVFAVNDPYRGGRTSRTCR